MGGAPGGAYDAIVVGAGPNGLAAASRLAERGFRTLVIEAAESVGGGTRTDELTLPGFHHDVCSAVHTMGIVSPYFRKLPLAKHGLVWEFPQASVAHPFADGRAVMLEPSLEETARTLGADAGAYRQLLSPFLPKVDGLLGDLLGPLRLPKHPLQMARFALKGLRSAAGLARRFRTEEARALFAGCAAHSILPFERLASGAFGLLFLLLGHVQPWPVARGGSQAIARALARHFESLGGEIRTGWKVKSLAELPASRVVLLDLAPRVVLELSGEQLPSGYRRRLGRYRYGPGVFKLDWALDGPIPWRDPNCARASTVHLGGSFEQIAAAERQVWRGEVPEEPFVLVCQQSLFDSTRAPAGQHTGYAYCHVPASCPVDRTEAIEAQIEKCAPGFRQRILARHSLSPAALERQNSSYVGGAIAGGVADLWQLFARPVARLDPYSTPNPRLFLCSHATPPGGGVHGMCGYHAAESAAKRLLRGKV